MDSSRGAPLPDEPVKRTDLDLVSRRSSQSRSAPDKRRRKCDVTCSERNWQDKTQADLASIILAVVVGIGVFERPSMCFVQHERALDKRAKQRSRAKSSVFAA